MSECPDPAWLDGDAVARLAAAERDDVDDAAAERVRAEAARTSLADRWRAAGGRLVTVRLVGGAQVAGTVVESGADWVWLGTPPGQTVVRLAAVLTAEGLGRQAQPAGSTAGRLAAGHALRRLAATGRPARLQLVDGAVIEGTLVAVLADGVEVVRHPRDRAPRTDDPSTVIGWTAVAAVSTD